MALIKGVNLSEGFLAAAAREIDKLPKDKADKDKADKAKAKLLKHGCLKIKDVK